MTQQLIDLGAAPNDGTGDTLREGASKINENFTEVYDLAGEATRGLPRTELLAYLLSQPFADETELEAYTNALLQVGDRTITIDGGVYVVTGLDPLTWVRDADSDGKKAQDAADAAETIADEMDVKLTNFGMLDPIEYELSGWEDALIDEGFLVLSGIDDEANYWLDGQIVGAATSTREGGQEIDFLDSVEYELSGYSVSFVDDDDVVLLGASVDEPDAEAATFDGYAYTAEDGDGDSQVYSVDRTNGNVLKLSSAGSNETNAQTTSDGWAIWKSDRADGPPGNLWASPLDVANEMPVVPRPRIVQVAHSFGYRPYSAGEQLATELGWDFVNLSLAGQGATGIAMRFGAIPFYITLTDDELTETGEVIVTAISDDRVLHPNGTRIDARLHGTLGVGGPSVWLYKTGNKSNPMPYAVEQDAGGTTIEIPPGTRFYPDGWSIKYPSLIDPSDADLDFVVTTDYYDDSVFVFDMIRNVYTALEENITALHACVNKVKTYHKRYFIPICQYGESDGFGTDNRAFIDRLNDRVKEEFPDHYIEQLPSLLAAGDGGAGDLADIAAGIPPRSLRLISGAVDALHGNAAYNEIVKDLMIEKSQLKGWNQ